jgi:hypothetical protein
MGPAGDLLHQCARHDDADRGHGRLPAREEPPRCRREHPRRRPLSGELVEQVPASAGFPIGLWLALSAYNLGMGHFRGARAIAQKLKRDPDVWYEMKQVLPQLARPEIYARLKSGAARGGEAVIMVENIRSYYDILCRFEAAHASPYAGSADCQAPALIFSAPPIQGRSTAGTVMLPSSFW